MGRRTGTGKWGRTFILSVLFFVVFYLEYFIYIFRAWSWDSLHCPPDSLCTKVLLVADPQLLGERDEPNWITLWDSDRYLYHTYSLAVKHTQPDAVIFLGDLMDEGNRADDQEFQRYIDRFFSIFSSHLNSKTFYLPGDNDIGGENGDPILPDVVHRFRHHFRKDIEMIVGSCRFMKVNPVIESMPNINPGQVSADRKIRIAVSHFPLLGMSTPFTDKIVKDFQPHIIFSAHSHLSRLKMSSEMTASPLTRLDKTSIGRKNHIKDAEFDDVDEDSSQVLEIEVPTCSYRMGVKEMGYGYALIDETRQELQYVVLWLPSRLIVLKFYLVTAVFLPIFALWWCFCVCGRSRHKHNLIHQP